MLIVVVEIILNVNFVKEGGFMLNLSNLCFLCIDYNFIYDKDVKKEDRVSASPAFVKINGLVSDDNKVFRSATVFEEFKNFNLTKNEFISKMTDNPVIFSSGTVGFDNNYNRRVNFQHLSFSKSFSISVK